MERKKTACRKMATYEGDVLKIRNTGNIEANPTKYKVLLFDNKSRIEGLLLNAAQSCRKEKAGASAFGHIQCKRLSKTKQAVRIRKYGRIDINVRVIDSEYRLLP